MESTNAPVPLDQLLAHRAWLRRIARALVADPQSADDLTQEVWLAALERPPRSRRSLRGWLATVLRRKAFDASRAAGRRTRHERGLSPGRPGAPADELLAETEIHRRVTDAVLALDEPYRSTLLLRYVADQPIARVAQLQGAPIETVRSRLKRGLERLRRQLDAGQSGSRGEWMTLLVPIARPGRSLALSARSVSTWTGGLVVTSKVFIALGAIAIAALAAWWTLGRADSEANGEWARGPEPYELARDGRSPSEAGPILRGRGGEQAVGGPPTRRTAAALPLVAPRASAPFPFVPRSAIAASGTSPTATAAEIRVVVGNSEAARGWVRVRPFAATPGAPPPPTEHMIGQDGLVRVPMAGDVYVEVRVEGRQARGLRLSADRKDKPVEVVFGTGIVFGTVRDTRGFPVAGVPVRLSTHLESTSEGRRPIAEGHVFGMSTSTDVAGAFRFEDLPVGDFVLVARRAADDPAADRNIRSVRVSLEAGESAQVDFGKEDMEPLLTGVLRYGDGVAVSRLVHMFMTTVEGGGRLYVNTDADGRYSQRVPAGTYEVELLIDVQYGTLGGMRIVPTSQRIVLEGRDPPLDIRFPGTRIEGRVRGYKPPFRQEVRASLVEPEGEVSVSRITKEPVTTQRVLVRKDGTFRLDGLSPGLWRLTGSPRALHPVEIRVDALRDVLLTDLDQADE